MEITDIPKVETEETAEYKEFVDKFKPKLTTDDCFTPPAVYEALLGWLVSEFPHLKDCRIVRPFYPGGDFENYPYKEGDVVVDNPPFSILARIVDFYLQHHIPFFIFANHLTLFGTVRDRLCTAVVTHADIIYENGAMVVTSFITNLYGDKYRAISNLTLQRILNDASEKEHPHKNLPRYQRPSNVLTINDLDKLLLRGVEMRIPTDAAAFIRNLQLHDGKKKGIYGGGYILGPKAAARLEAARLETARLEAARLEAARRNPKIMLEHTPENLRRLMDLHEK